MEAPVRAKRARAPKRRADGHERESYAGKRRRKEGRDLAGRVDEPLEEPTERCEGPDTGVASAEDMENCVASDDDVEMEEEIGSEPSEEDLSNKRKTSSVSGGRGGELHAEEEYGDEAAEDEPVQEDEEDDDSFATVGPELTEDWEFFKSLSLEDLTAYGLAHGEVKTGKRALTPYG